MAPALFSKEMLRKETGYHSPFLELLTSAKIQALVVLLLKDTSVMLLPLLPIEGVAVVHVLPSYLLIVQRTYRA